MPIDINELRSYKGGDPDKYRKYMEQRYRPVEWVDQVLAEDEVWRQLTVKRDNLRREVNSLQKEIAPLKKAKQDATELIAQMKTKQEEIKRIEQVDLPEAEAKRDNLLNRIGNIVDPEVPISDNEDEHNLVVALYPKPVEQETKADLLPCAISELEYTFPASLPMQHDDLLWRIDGYEPQRGQQVAGHRGYFLKNAGTFLNQALISYGLAFLRKKGYDLLQPPFMMNRDVMAGIAQLEDFDEQLYKVSGKTDEPSEGDKYLIATSEQPICAYHKNEWLDPKTLPKRYAGFSSCFRKEAGSSGRDIRGIFRVHQFEKIEQFCVTDDSFEVSQAEQSFMRANAEEFYQSLGIPYRVVCIVSGALNDAAVKKYDIEGWFPGQGTYRELVSCSNCTDYQARAVGTRCGQTKSGSKELTARASYCHFLNSTLCATGRGICAILENYQTEDGVRVPEVLQPYMMGIDFLPFVRESMEATKGEKGDKGGKKQQQGKEESKKDSSKENQKKKQKVEKSVEKGASVKKQAAGAPMESTKPPPTAADHPTYEPVKPLEFKRTGRFWVLEHH